MNSLGVLLMSMIALAVLCGSRAGAAASVLAAMLYLPQQQSLDIGGFTITGLRLIEIVAFLRISLRGDLYTMSRSGIDKLFLATYLYTAGVFLYRSAVAIPETIGWAGDTLLCYLIFRSLVRSEDDFRVVLQRFAVLLVPYVVLLAIEVQTGSNPFSALGTWTSWVELREERVRAMGSFRNPSLLGTLGACFLPLYLALAFRRAGRAFALVGAAACLYIVYASNSGGPLSAMGVGLLGWLLWRLRSRMRALRLTALILLLALALSMQAPVWSLLERVSFVTGGSGWHRAHLVTMFWNDGARWWLAGMPLSETVQWFPYALATTGTADITNTFVDFGLKAGLPALCLFLWLISAAFGAVGRAIAAQVEGATDDARHRRFLLWGLGCALATHIATWFGITYFDQSFVLWVLHVAVIASLTGVRSAPALTPGYRARDRALSPPEAPRLDNRLSARPPL